MFCFSEKFNGGGFRAGGKPSSGDGKVIQIINADQQHIKEKVLLNLKTTQPFEDVLLDLGQVTKDILALMFEIQLLTELC